MSRCDGCLKSVNDAEDLVTTVCSYHWHYFCRPCFRIVLRRGTLPADRPKAHFGYDNAMQSPWVWCPMGCDAEPVPEEIIAFISLRRCA